MKQLQISEQTAKELYKTSTDDFKRVLEETFTKEFFIEDITEKIKTLDDVYKHLGFTRNPPYKIPLSKQEKSINAFYDIQNISLALNEGWIPNWSDTDEYKYYNYFEKKVSGWCFDGSDVCRYFADGGFGFYFKTPKLASYAAKTFLNIYIDYLPE